MEKLTKYQWPPFQIANCINFIDRRGDHQRSKAQDWRESHGLKAIVAIAGVAVLVHVQEDYIVLP